MDYLSDGSRTYAIENGSHWLGKITGSGCALGSLIASYVAMHKVDKFQAALAAMLHYEVAAESAATRDDVHGPGSFIPAFVDELYLLADELAKASPGAESGAFLHRLKVRDVSLQDS